MSLINHLKTSLRPFLKLSKDVAFRTDDGSEFHSLGADIENDLSYKDVRDLGTVNVPLIEDLRLRLWVSDIGFCKFVMYSGV